MSVDVDKMARFSLVPVVCNSGLGNSIHQLVVVMMVVVVLVLTGLRDLSAP